MSTKSIPITDLTPPAGYKSFFLLGGVAAALASIFVIANWTLAVSAALIVVALSALENEPFLLSIIFLLPIGWFVKIDLPLGGKDARLDIATAVRLLADMADLKLMIVDRVLYVTLRSNTATFPPGLLPAPKKSRIEAAA